MSISLPFRLSLATVAFIASTLGCAAATNAAADSAPTFSGSYLAARSADQANDFGDAAGFYRDAVAADQNDRALSQRLLILTLASGDTTSGFRLAAKMASIDPNNPAVILALATQNMGENNPDAALSELQNAGRADLPALTASVASAWIEFGQGKVDAALSRIAALKGPDWYPLFTDLHTALINDAAGRTDAAVAAARKAYGDDGADLRVAVAFARILARAGKADEAAGVLTRLGGDNPARPELRYLLADIKAGKTLGPLVGTAREGFAEILYDLGSLVGVEQGPELPMTYLQLASYLVPDSSMVRMSLGNVFVAIDRCDVALTIYDKIPQSDLVRRNADLQTALCLESLDQSDRATPYLERVLATNPDDLETVIDLGNNYRVRHQFAEAAATYTHAIALTGITVDVPGADAIAAAVAPPPVVDNTITDEGAGADDSQALDSQPSDSDEGAADTVTAEPPAPADAPQTAAPQPVSPRWSLFFFRAMAYSQANQWPEAEADLKRALALNPDQAAVLNYLGYSWVDRGENLDLALKLIEKAVRLKPTDGAIIDSLGWAYYKTGKIDAAVTTMEQAARLSGGDATINDHLGDVYWTAGRKREAIFQWTYARDSDPDKDLLPKVLQKLQHGLGAPPTAGSKDHSATEIEKGENTAGPKQAGVRLPTTAAGNPYTNVP